jgi:hypothetical protein
MGLAILGHLLSGGLDVCPFSSLFIGMGLAMVFPLNTQEPLTVFQFPFHRDGPCDALP